MIYVTHDQVEAMTMADKIVVLRGGRVEQIGAPLDLYNRPREPVRRRVHRLAADEFSAGARGRRRSRTACGLRAMPARRMPAAPLPVRGDAAASGGASRSASGPEHIALGGEHRRSVALAATIERLEQLGAHELSLLRRVRTARR